MAFCTKCGAEISDDSSFCTACGEKVAQENDVELKVENAQPEAENSAAAEPELVLSETVSTPVDNVVADAEFKEAEQNLNQAQEDYSNNADQTFNQHTDNPNGQTSGGTQYKAGTVHHHADTAQQYTTSEPTPGDGKAKVALILGIIGIVCSVIGLFTGGILSIAGLVLGIIGLVQASGAKKLGCENGNRKAGFVLSLLAIILGALLFILALACVGACLGAAATAGAMY